MLMFQLWHQTFIEGSGSGPVKLAFEGTALRQP